MNGNIFHQMNKNIVFTFLVILALTERVFFDLGPNFEFVTGALMLSGAYLGKNYSICLVLLIMAVSDLVLGNTNIFLFTWSGFLIPALILTGLFKQIKVNRVFSGTVFGIATSLFFYIWTNFGVWMLDSWGMYSKDLNGLAMAYVNGLPFLRYSLVSTIMLVPASFFLFETYLYVVGHLASLSSKSLSSLHQNWLRERV